MGTPGTSTLTINATGGTGTITSVLTANATPQFVLTGTTETVDFGLSNLILGDSGTHITSATENVGFGASSLAALTTGTQNVAIGNFSLLILTSGGFNTCVGNPAGQSITTGSSNTFIGAGSGSDTSTGSFNTCVGFSSGSALNPGDSSNILIGAGAAPAGSNRIIIGLQGSAPTEQNFCQIAGIVGVTVANPELVTINSATGQLGVAPGTLVGQTITGNDGNALSPTAGNWNIFGDGVTASGVSTAGNIWTTGTGSTLTVQPTQAQFMTNYTSVAIGASPYTALATDYYISVVSSGGAITIKLPNAPTTNRLFIIKDKSGNATTDNISVTTVGGAVTIDGQTTATIDSNFGSLQLLFNGTSYEIY